MLGPTRLDYKWQAQAGEGFAASNFEIDWERERAICPTGHESLNWTPAVDNRRHDVMKIKFSMRDCQPCANRVKCTRAKRRTITLRRRDQSHALQAVTPILLSIRGGGGLRVGVRGGRNSRRDLGHHFYCRGFNQRVGDEKTDQDDSVERPD
jgi:hypothetical protein